jgi:hypothetical protein
METTKRFRRSAPMPAPDLTLVNDRLEGARAIAAFWFGSSTTQDMRRVFRLIDLKVIPVVKVGGRIMASKKVLKEHYERLTSSAAE